MKTASAGFPPEAIANASISCCLLSVSQNDSSQNKLEHPAV